MLKRIPGRVLAVGVAVALLATTFLVLRGGEETRSVSAHFPRAVSVFVGTDVRVLGVNIGKVTAVVPEGNSVLVEMEYDDQYKLPAGAKAVIVTPTLVADRFVQITPAYDGSGAVMADGGDIALPETAVPVELDRIYASLRDLSQALGPNGVNKDGTLDNLLKASAKALEGEGELGNEMIRNLSAATETFGEGSENLFATVSELAEFTQVLGANDRLVRAFIRDLGGHVVGPGHRARGAAAGAGLRRPGRGHREDVRRGQPRGVDHRHREAHPRREEHELRAGEHRRRPAGRAAGPGQPGRGVQHQDRVDRLADRCPGHVR